jgi:hypothetical protein
VGWRLVLAWMALHRASISVNVHEREGYVWGRGLWDGRLGRRFHLLSR